MKNGEPAGIRPFRSAAGGSYASKAVAENLARQRVMALGSKTLLRANLPDGFGRPGCAWPDLKHTSSLEFCENGAKAVAVSAPSALAIRTAESCGITLVAIARGQDFEIFTHPHRIVEGTARHVA